VVRHACESAGLSALSRRCALLACVLLLFVACKHDKRTRGPKLTPLQADAWLIDLEVPGFGKAKLAVPLGATSPRAIVIALHGAADRPEWACSALRSIAGPAPFVLCPRGVQRADFNAADPRYTFGTADATANELRVALAQLKHRFGLYVAPGPVIFTGFELGADHVAWITSQEPAFFSRVLLIEPAPESWPSSQAALFARSGGQRALFAFGPAHRDELQQKAILTGRGGAEAHWLFLGSRPPALDPPTVALLARQWRWLAAPIVKPATIENVAGNPLSVEGPKARTATERPAP
jgi:hypothetical protein